MPPAWMPNESQGPNLSFAYPTQLAQAAAAATAARMAALLLLLTSSGLDAFLLNDTLGSHLDPSLGPHLLERDGAGAMGGYPRAPPLLDGSLLPFE